MKRFLILFVLCVTTTFGAYGKAKDVTISKFEGLDKNIPDIELPKDPVSPVDDSRNNNVTYTFSSGNGGACYVNKASRAIKPSTYWFCGKTTPKCDGNGWFSTDDVKTLDNGKSFSYGETTYLCCYDEKKSDTGMFKIYQAPKETQNNKYELSGTNGGWCYNTISTDVCGNVTITKPCTKLTNCPSGTVIHNGKCADQCPAGQDFESGTSDKCKSICGANEAWKDGKCEATTNKKEETTLPTSAGSVGSQQPTTTTTTNDSQTTTTTTVTTISSGTIMGEMHIGGQNITGKPATVVTYETLFNDSKSCYVRKPSDDSDKTLFWCGKPDSSKCGDYKQSEIEDWVVLREKTDVVSTVDNYCCCDGTESKAGEFRKCTEPGTRTKIKKIGGGLCQYTVKVDRCNRETIEKDCTAPDSTLSIAGKTPVTKSNMQECGLCTTKDDFKKCVINSCYEIDASGSLCPNKLKTACSIKK